MFKRTPVLVLLLLFGFVGVASLQTPGPVVPARFTGLDVTILVDQSGSMWGSPKQVCGPQKRPCATRNDKFDHRIGQTKNIIYRLAEHVENTSFVHRVSVIDFGSDAAVALSNLQMRFKPNDPGGALRDTKIIVESKVKHRDGVQGINTNTPQAMEVALGEYQKMAASQPNSGRQRVMLIVTDGSPNNPPKDRATLQNEVRDQAAKLKTENVSAWVVGLNDESNYWNDGDGTFWEGIAGKGHARLAESASSKIFTLAQDIVDEWLGSQSQLITGNEYQCPPYLGRIVFSVNFNMPGSTIRIIDPNGNDVPLSSGGATTAPRTFARYVVEDPKPGLFKLIKDPARSYTVSAEVYSADIKRLSPPGAVSHETEARLVFQAIYSQGTPVDELSNWPVSAAMAITPQSGATNRIPANFIGDGKWMAKWKPPQTGTYTVRLEGLVTMPNGKPYDVFGANAKSYDDQLVVSNLHPYFLRLDTPDPTGGLRLMPTAKSALVSFSLVDLKNAPVTNLAGLVNNPGTWLSLQLIDKAGQPLPAPPLPLAVTANGSFETTVPVSISLQNLWQSGQLNFRVTAQPDRLGKDNYLDSIQLPPDAESLRVGGDPMTVGPLKIRYSWMVLGPALLILLAGLAGLAWFIWRSLLPGMAIKVADYSRGRAVMLKVYDGDQDPAGDGAKKLQAAGWHQFKFDRQVSLQVNGENFIAEKFRIKRQFSSDVRVVVEYVWQKDPAKKVHRSIVSKNRLERLKGIGGEPYLGSYVVSLEVK